MRVKRFIGNIILLGITLILSLALFEFGVFKYVLKTNDVLNPVTVNSVIRYAPQTKASFYGPDGYQSHIRVNADGWNSPLDTYRVNKQSGKLRIAVVGDSYVHARLISTENAFPEVMRRALGTKGHAAEVLRFGIDGAPLSQYLHMMRKEVVRYQPDVVVVPLIHNDFHESYQFLRGRYASSFMKVRVEDGKVREEVQPEDYKPGWADVIRQSRTFRYLYYQTGAVNQLRGLVNRYVWGGNSHFGTGEVVSSAVDIRDLDDSEKMRIATRYLVHEMKKLAQEHGFRLLFVMDGVREAVYSGRPVESYKVGMLNKMAREEVEAAGLPFHDLQEDFTAHYKSNQQRFEFSWDWHWNPMANKLVGEKIADLIVAEGLIDENAGQMQLRQTDVRHLSTSAKN